MKKVLVAPLLLVVLSSCSLFEKQNAPAAKKQQVDLRVVQNVVIVGSGPAGLTAGIYAARAGLQPIIIEGSLRGGLLTKAPHVENWPGAKSIEGAALMEKIAEHASDKGCVFVSDIVTNVDFSKDIKRIATEGELDIKTKSVIIATGSKYKKLDVPGEKEYLGRGVSYCATCDAPLYKGKDVIVLGGGKSAFFEAEHLAHISKSVKIIHTSAEFKVTGPLKDRVLQKPNVSVVHNAVVKEVKGDNVRVTHLVLEDKIDKKVFEIKADGVFVAIGLVPNTSIFKDVVELDERGFVVLKEDMKTSVEGVFAAGDVTTTKYKQAITSAGDGAKAAFDCQRFLAAKK